MNPDTGRVYEVEEREPPKFYFSIEKYPDSSCKHCHGRGYTGRDTITGHVIPCRCVGNVKVVDNRDKP